jgi:tetratricopeptide (TPR) repeat protein
MIAFLPAQSSAAVSAAAFDSANKLYEEGKFADAAAAYEKLAQSGETSAALYFNLGNAFFKSGQIGRAVAAYRTAQQITPRDPDLRANLQFARNQAQRPTLSPDRWQRWLGRLTLNEWTVLAAVGTAMATGAQTRPADVCLLAGHTRRILVRLCRRHLA